MTANSQPIRVHDYTALATLGLATIYNNIGMQLEEEQEQLAAEAAGHQSALRSAHELQTASHLRGGHAKREPYSSKSALSPSSSSSSRLADNRPDAERTPVHKRRGVPNSTNTSCDYGDALAAASLHLQSPIRRIDRANIAASSSGKSKGSAPKRARTSTNGNERLKLKSAFARVVLDRSLAEGDAIPDSGGASVLGCKGKLRSAGSLNAMADHNAGSVEARPKEYGEVWFGRYMILHKLGEGAFSQAFLAADLFCNRMGKRRESTRLVTIKRMGAKEGIIGVSDYQTILMLNRLDPKDRIPIVRIYDIFLHRSHQQHPRFSYSGISGYRNRKNSNSNNSGGRNGGSNLGRAIETQGLRVFNNRAAATFSKPQPTYDAYNSSASTVADPDDEHICLVMEPLLGSTLHDAFPKRIKTLYATHDEAVARGMHMDMIRTTVRQLLVAVAHMHSSSLIHADIKTTNVICVDDSTMRVKLIDFGNAVSDGNVSEYYATFEIQTVWFRAPEVAYRRPFGRAIDIWSIGCIMCELWLGRSLFTDMDNRNLIRSILRLRGPPPASLYSASPFYPEVAKSWGGRPSVGFAPAAVSNGRRSIIHPEQSIDWDPQLRMQWLKHSLRVHDDEFVSLADALLEYDPEERPTAAQALEHPFFQGMYAL